MIPFIFRNASRWIFFAALAYAPWAYGATTAASIETTNWILLAALVLWGFELATAGRRPQFPTFLLLLVAALLCVGGWMTLNAKSIYDSEFSFFVPVRNFAPPLTGSVDYAISGAWIIRGGLLLGTMLFVSDLSQSSRWLLRLWYVVGLVGGSIAFLGLLQKATGAQMIFWRPPPPPEFGVTTFFATYFYHGNAGAFLNLVWPLSAGLVIRSFTRRSEPGLRALWVIVFILTIAAVLANTSRMAQLVAVLLLIAIGLHFGPALLRKLSGAQRSVAVAGAFAIVLALIALAQATHLEQPLNRWQSVSERIPADARWQASRVALECAARRRILRVWARNISSCVPKLQPRIGPSGPRHLEIFTPGLPSDCSGVGMAGKYSLGLAFLWRNSDRNSQLQQICCARLDAEKTRAAASGYCVACRSGPACRGRFSLSNRVDPAICRNVSGPMLGQQPLEPAVGTETLSFRGCGYY